MSSFEEIITRKYINSLSRTAILNLHKKYPNDDVFYYVENIDRMFALEMIEKEFSTIDLLNNHLNFEDIKFYIENKPEEIAEYTYWLSNTFIENSSKEEIIKFYLTYKKDVNHWSFAKFFETLSIDDFNDELAIAYINYGSYINKDEPVVVYALKRIKEDVNMLVEILKSGVHESFVYYFVNKDVEYADKITLDLFKELYNISPRYSYYYLTEALKFGYYEILNDHPNYQSYLYSSEHFTEVNLLDINKLNFVVDIKHLIKKQPKLKYETVKDHITLFKYLLCKL